MSVVMTGTATKMIVMINTVVTVPGLPAVAIMKIVVPGLHPRRGNLMIEGLQGTMITGEEAMMTADHLIIMMIVAGMTMNENATTEDAMKKKIVTTTGLQDPRMGMYGVEEFITGVWIREKNIFVIAFAFRILDFSDPCGVTVVYRAPCISLMVGQPFPEVAYWRNRLLRIRNGYPYSYGSMVKA
jgi:hypothetical protein